MRKLLLVWLLIQFISLPSYAVDEEIVWVNTGPTKEFIESKREWARRDAQRDILQNKLGGFYLSQFGEKNEEIKIAVLKKYNIVGKGVACVVLPGQKEYSEVYDAIIEAEILRRYGKDFWVRVENEINIEIARVSREHKKLEK